MYIYDDKPLGPAGMSLAPGGLVLLIVIAVLALLLL